MQNLPNIRKTRLEINLYQLEKNFQAIEKKIAPSEILAIVKSNAYGHGILEISSYLENLPRKNSLHGFGVATIEEGLLLRKHGIKKPVYIMSGAFNLEERAFQIIIEYKLIPFLNSLQTLKSFSAFLDKKKKQSKIHLKFNTGMNRLGINFNEVEKCIKLIKKSKNIELHGIVSHFSASEDKKNPSNKKQISNFEKIIELFHKNKMRPKYIHLSNSCAIKNNFFSKKENLVRVGIGLYGQAPFRSSTQKKHKEPQPIAKWVAEIYEIRSIKKGECIGYAPAFKAKKDMKVAVLAVGYGDGYARALSNKADVLIQGRRCPIVGNISMDLITVDISKLKTVNKQKEAILLGKDGKEHIDASELAAKTKTISYNILTSISDRIHRVFIRK